MTVVVVALVSFAMRRFGHLGDGNLHLNVSTPGAPYSKAILEEIEPYVYVLCQGDSVGIHA